eukprot:2668221-Pyramimonas_sp.AAC.1
MNPVRRSVHFGRTRRAQHATSAAAKANVSICDQTLDTRGAPAGAKKRKKLQPNNNQSKLRFAL